MTLEYVGYAKLRPGRIHLLCPVCGRKMSNVERDQYDPPSAVLAHVHCERCSQGCKIEGAAGWLDARGRWVDPFDPLADERDA